MALAYSEKEWPIGPYFRNRNFHVMNKDNGVRKILGENHKIDRKE